MVLDTGSWPSLTIVTGPAGLGKSTHVRAALSACVPTSGSARREFVRPHLWLDLLPDQHHTEIAAALLVRLRRQVCWLPADLVSVAGHSAGPTAVADPAARAEQVGAIVGRSLAEMLQTPLALVLDGLEQVNDPATLRLIESLVRSAPPTLKLVLVSRTAEMPFRVDRLTREGRFAWVGPAQLTKDADQAEAILAAEGVTGPETTSRLVASAKGSVGALLAAAAWTRRTDERLPTHDGAGDLTRSLVTRLLSVEERLTLVVLHSLGSCTKHELSQVVGVNADEVVGGLLRDHLMEQAPGDTPRYRVQRLAAEACATAVPSAVVSAGSALAVARGDPLSALRLAELGPHRAVVLSTLRHHGDGLIRAGAAAAVLRAVDRLPEVERLPLRGLAGRAAYALGDWERAIRDLEAAAGHEVTCADAWRQGLVLYLQGDPAAARSVLDRGLRAWSRGQLRSDLAMVAGFAAAVDWISGDLDAARAHTDTSMSSATDSGDERAQAVAHTAAALIAASSGDQMANEWHYCRALSLAERAGDLLQVARIHSNRGSRLMEEGDYLGSQAELDQAVTYAELGGYGSVLGIARANRGEVMTKLGRLDEGRHDLVSAVELLQQQGSRLAAYPLAGLARLFLMRGDMEQARASAERALALSRDSGDRQVGVVTRIQLARALTSADLARAREYAAEAVAMASTSVDEPEAWVVSGWLALRAGADDEAAACADRATRAARSRSSRWSLAQALELGAAVTADPTRRREQFAESHALFLEVGCAIDAARLELRLLEDRPGPHASARLDAVADLAQRLNGRPLAAEVERLRTRLASRTPPVRLAVLGAFGLWRDGEAADPTAWQSKKARTLVKMLVTRRGRPLPRDVVVERLWPDDEPTRTSARLSVLLATARGVLDPHRRHAPDRFLKADAESVWLDTDAVDCDVEDFLSLAGDALAAHRATPGADPVISSMLAGAETAYHGDVLDEDPYAEWHVPLREEARSTYLAVVAALASRRIADNELDDAVRLLLRLVEREPYDEHGQLSLVGLLSRLGRHGDARRRYQDYSERMREIDIEPAPFPSRRPPEDEPKPT